MIDDSELVAVLLQAISPVVLISGVGLLLLSITNRFGRTTDRARLLVGKRSTADDAGRDRIDRQLRILYRRSRVLLLSTSMALASVLFAALLIMALFGDYMLGGTLRPIIVLFFMLSLACLVASLVMFIQDMSLSLRALREEVGGYL